MKVAFRTDASNTIGSGHIMRCKTLADELRRRGADIRFVCRDHAENLSALLRENGYMVKSLPKSKNSDQPGGNYAAWLGATQDDDAAQTQSAIADFAADWLVVDHYGLDETWEKSLRPCVGRIFAIDDLANRRHDCDLLLDQNWFGAATRSRYDELIPDTCRRMLGPRHALIQPLFRALRDSRPAYKASLGRVLVFFGAVDSYGQTVKALRALSTPRLADVAVDVVVGSANRSAAEIAQLAARRPRTELHHHLPSLAELMASADLMLGAGGSTTWERCCLGLPGVVVAAGENQQGFTRVLADEGAHLYLGPAAEVTETGWVTALENLRDSPQTLTSFATSAARITDGLGSLRVAATLLQEAGHFRLRRATPFDELLLLEWANDPAVRRHAFSTEPISLESHRDWLKKKLADPDCLLLIGQDDYGLPVGQVRFDLHDQHAHIDISVEPVLRGRGLGVLLLGQAIALLKQENRASTAVGEVLPGNLASCAIFLRSGFTADPSIPGRNGSHRFVLPLNSVSVRP